MKKIFYWGLISLLFTCCSNKSENKFSQNDINTISSSQSILIFEEGWEVWGSIVIFKKENLYANTSKIYNEERELSAHGGGMDSFLLSKEAFQFIADFIRKSNIHTEMPYMNPDTPLFSLFKISIDDIISLENNKFVKNNLYKGFTFYPDETIKFYVNLKNNLMTSEYRNECLLLIKSIDKIVILNAERQKKLAEK